MGLFRSRKRERANGGTSQQAAAAPLSSSFRVGEKVRLTDHAVVFPVGSIGEIETVRSAHGQTTYSVIIGDRQPIDVAEHLLEPVPTTIPGQIEVGTRVRLTKDYDGTLVEESFATERDDQESDRERVHYDVGTTGTVIHRQDGFEEHFVLLDHSGMILAVRSHKLESLPGCVRIVQDADDTLTVRQYFAYLDAVALREDVTLNDGTGLKKGAVGAIRPMSAHSPVAQEMQESWRTGVYTVCFWLGEAGNDVHFDRFEANLLQLNTDL